MRHEANAGIAAAVYGKLKGQPGVVIATLGPGAANLLLPVANSYLDQEPLLAITAQIPDDFPSSHTHQLLPLHETYRPMCKVVEKVTCANAGEAVNHALDACIARPFGVSYLTLSAREATKTIVAAVPSPNGHAPAAKEPGGDAGAVARALASRLERAERPLVLVGLSIDPSNASRLRKWIGEWNLPVAVTPKVKGIVDETASNFVGVISGMAADGLMVEALKAADLLIGFGLDPVEVDKTWHAELPIDWVLESPNAAGRVPDGVRLVDHAPLLDALVAAAPPRAWQAPFKPFQDRRRALLRGDAADGAVMWPGDLIRTLNDAVPADTIVTTDVGSHKY